LATKKVFPALFGLDQSGEAVLPECTSIVGYARSSLTSKGFRERLAAQLRSVGVTPNGFLEKRVTYVAGPYKGDAGFKRLRSHLRERERRCFTPGEAVAVNRMFYLALPPTAFVDAARGIRAVIAGGGGWTRLVVEKPFGRDTASSQQLAADLSAAFPEDKDHQVFRIDHYLGKPMVRDLPQLRAAAFPDDDRGLWSRRHIQNIEIVLKETAGTLGRGGYFDDVGIIRDVMQNHVAQLVALVAMAPAEGNLRRAKVAALRSIRPALARETVIGQYTRSLVNADAADGYLDDASVPRNSTCATFVSTVLWIDSDRWMGVPFVLTAGKALDTNEVAVRVTFKNSSEFAGAVAVL
jgi:glucose-6-phosphate 1-dehydrogenase